MKIIKNLKFISFLALAAFLAGCASGSTLVTGEKRAPIEANQVKLYLDPPSNYETIGLVQAESASGWSPQDSQDYAIEELKKQAASIGANGVLLETVSDKVFPGTVGPDGQTFGDSITNKVVKGRAIFVKR